MVHETSRFSTRLSKRDSDPDSNLRQFLKRQEFAGMNETVTRKQPKGEKGRASRQSICPGIELSLVRSPVLADVFSHGKPMARLWWRAWF